MKHAYLLYAAEESDTIWTIGAKRGSQLPRQVRIEPHNPIFPDREISRMQSLLHFHRTTANARIVP